MTRTLLLTRLGELPGQIRDSERHLLNRQCEMDQAEQAVKDAEARLLTMDFSPINGKNAETREAQLWSETRGERSMVAGCRNARSVALIERDRLLNEFRSVRSAVQLLTSSEAER